MSKNKGPRIIIILECTKCRKDIKDKVFGVSRYITSKNRRNTPEKIELSKYCRYCNKSTFHKEIK